MMNWPTMTFRRATGLFAIVLVTLVAAGCASVPFDHPKSESHAVEPSDSTRLGELLAWRGFVDSVREWPLDAGALARLALYVGIGLASWVGAALVEHALFG